MTGLRIAGTALSSPADNNGIFGGTTENQPRLLDETARAATRAATAVTHVNHPAATTTTDRQHPRFRPNRRKIGPFRIEEPKSTTNRRIRVRNNEIAANPLIGRTAVNEDFARMTASGHINRHPSHRLFDGG